MHTDSCKRFRFRRGWTGFDNRLYLETTRLVRQDPAECDIGTLAETCKPCHFAAARGSGALMVTNQTVEDPHGLRMMAVLHESVRTRGERATADWLGIDRRTLVTCLEQGELSLKIRVALDNELRSEIDSEQAEIRALVRKQDARIGDLESRVAGIAGDLDRLETALKAGREESAKGLRALTRQVERLNTQGNPETFGGAARQPAGSGAGKSGARTGRAATLSLQRVRLPRLSRRRVRPGRGFRRATTRTW